MSQVPNRIDATAIPWFYLRHRMLWDWIAGLTEREIIRIVEASPGTPRLRHQNGVLNGIISGELLMVHTLVK